MNRFLQLAIIVCLTITTQDLLAQPTADFTASPLAGCAPHVVYFTSTSTGGPTSYFWDFGNGVTSVLASPSTTYVTPGNYTVTLTVSNANGSNTKTLTNYITVHPNPAVAFSASDTADCPPLFVQFSNSSNPNLPGNTTYNWSFGDGTPFSTAQNPSHTYANSGYYNVALTVTNSAGCATTLTKQNYIEIYTPPVADFSANSATLCSIADSVSFTPSVTGTGPYTYSWNFGDGTTDTASNPSHIYTTPGTYSISMIVTDVNGCADTVVKSNYINIGTLTASFTASPAAACIFRPVQFTSATTGSMTVFWDFGDGATSTAPHPTHTFSTSDTFNVTLVVSENGCSDTLVVPYTVHPQPAADFSFTPLHPCPAPATVQFTNNSTGATSYYWTFGDGGFSAATNPSHTYTTNDTNTVQLIATSAFGCPDTVALRDTVHNMFFSWNPLYAEGCAPLDVHFNVSLLTNTPNATTRQYPYDIATYFWDFGDGATSTLDTPLHTYTTQGVYTVTLTVTTVNGCTWTDTSKVTAGYLPVASFTGFPDTVCVDERVHFVNTSTNIDTATLYTWYWNYPGMLPATGGEDGIFSYEGSGTYSVMLEANTYGCRDSFAVTDAVVVDPPTAIWNPVYNCDTTLKVQFIDTSSIDPTSLIWFFGDGTSSTSSNPDHTYPTHGNYTVTLVTFNNVYGCSDTTLKNIRLVDPVLSFSTPDTAICKGDAIVFTANYTDVPDQFLWQVNGQYQFNPNPFSNQWGRSFNQNGIYTISVMTHDIHECWDTATRTNYVLVAKPTAAFTGSPIVGCTPLNVNFSENSTNTTGAFSVTREWDFGNGTDTVTTASTSNVYNIAGLYTVKLIVTDNVGCKDTLEKLSYIDARNPVANFAASAVNGCIGQSISFTNGSTGTALTASWDFGDGTTSTVFAPSKIYNQTGIYTVKLVVTDPVGCSDTMIRTAYINISKPVASFIMSDTMAICPPLNISLTNTTTGALTYAWDFGNGNTSSAQNPTATYPNPGVYTLTLVAADAYGCTDTAYGRANVLGYAGGLTYTPLAGCMPLTVKFTANLSNVPSIIWDFSDGVTMPLTGSDTVIHTYTTPGAYVPKLILSDNSGCQNSSLGIDTIKVDAVHAGFITSPPCVNTPITFSDTSFSYFSSITQWSWQFNGQETSNVREPIVNYPASGTYPVSLVAVNSRGCKDSITRNVTILDLPVISAGDDTTICNGDAAVLSGTGGTSYSWAPIATLSCGSCPVTDASPAVSTQYSVTGTDQNGCQNKDTVLVNVQYITSSAVESGGSICIDSVFQLRASGAEKYEWKPAATLSAYNIPNPIASPSVTTDYTVLAWEGSCPPDSHKVRVTVFSKPVVDAGSDVTIVAGSSTMLQAIGTNITDFAWSPAATLSCETCSNPVASPKLTTTYKVIAFTKHGCRSYDTVRVYILCDNSQLFVPNTFTPNNDGENDIFYPRGEGLQVISSFRVYNRWGQIIFERKNIQLNDAAAGWDGTYKGEQLNPDVFVYVIDGTCDTGDPISWKGDINLIR